MGRAASTSEPNSKGGGMFRNILVPTDGSALSRKAVKSAVRLAKEQKAKLTAVYVSPP